MKSLPLKHLVEAGQVLLIDTQRLDPPIGLLVLPGSGGTMTVEGSTSREAYDGSAADVYFEAWPAGTVSVPTRDTLVIPVVALRVTAEGANGVFEVVSA